MSCPDRGLRIRRTPYALKRCYNPVLSVHTGASDRQRIATLAQRLAVLHTSDSALAGHSNRKSSPPRKKLGSTWVTVPSCLPGRALKERGQSHVHCCWFTFAAVKCLVDVSIRAIWSTPSLKHTSFSVRRQRKTDIGPIVCRSSVRVTRERPAPRDVAERPRLSGGRHDSRYVLQRLRRSLVDGDYKRPRLFANM